MLADILRVALVSGLAWDLSLQIFGVSTRQLKDGKLYLCVDDRESKATFVFKLPPKFTLVSAPYGSPSILHNPLFPDHANKGEISHHGEREGIGEFIAVKGGWKL